MTEEKKELEKKETALPPAVTGEQRGGLPRESNEDIDLPYVFLLQPGSPQVLAPNSELKAGQVIDSFYNEPVPHNFVPISVGKKWVKQYEDEEENLVTEWRTKDPFDKRVLEFIKLTREEKRDSGIKESWEYSVLFEGKIDIPRIMTFKSSSYGAGRRLYSLFKISKEDMWNRKYKWEVKMKQEKIKGKPSTWFIYLIDLVGSSTQEERKEASRWFATLDSQKYNIETDREEDDAPEVKSPAPSASPSSQPKPGEPQTAKESKSPPVAKAPAGDGPDWAK